MAVASTQPISSVKLWSNLNRSLFLGCNDELTKNGTVDIYDLKIYTNPCSELTIV
jgi:hypothetical protein